VLYLNLANLQTVATLEQGQALLGRWQKLGPDLDGRIANLRRGLAAGKVATRGSVERVLRQLDDMLAASTADWVLLAPARRSTATGRGRPAQGVHRRPHRGRR
jgi:uncharacterized protein (DUF885 family)